MFEFLLICSCISVAGWIVSNVKIVPEVPALVGGIVGNISATVIVIALFVYVY